MGRLIEVSDVGGLPDKLVVQVGDLLLFRATGGRIRSGEGLANIGAFIAGAIAGDGRIIAAVGAPDAAVFHAVQPGRALIDLFTGDPWREPRQTTVAVEVQAVASP